MTSTQTFTANLQPVSKTTSKIIIPFDVEKVFGLAHPPIAGTINDYPYRTTASRLSGVYLMVVNNEMRQGANAQPGDEVTVTMKVDDQPRVVEIPEDLAAAFKVRTAAASLFEALSFSHKNEYIAWLDEAKTEQTRAARVKKAVEMIQVHVRTPR